MNSDDGRTRLDGAPTDKQRDTSDAVDAAKAKKRKRKASGGASAGVPKKPSRSKRLIKGVMAPIDIRGELDAKTIAAITAQYKEKGLVILQLLDKAVCGELVLEQWKEVILRQPFTDDHKIRVRGGANGRELKVDTDQELFLKMVTESPLPKKTRSSFEKSWCLHRGFGACCDPAVFHLPGVWQKIRQNVALYDVARALIGRKDIWVDLNRSIQKLPGQGDNEFLHWDMNPFAAKKPMATTGTATTAAATHSSNTGSASATLTREAQGLCGKVCYTRSRFVAVLESHTETFHRSFVDKYKAHYPKAKATATKFGLDAEKEDPLGLWEKQREFTIPAGCVVFWHPDLLHGQVKTPLEDPIEYGCYLGYILAESRSEYQRLAGVDELADRKASFKFGRAPILWPSLDEIQYYPKRFQNFPKILQSYINKMPDDHPGITTRTTKGGKVVPHLVPVPDPAYVAPMLSSLGRRLLGTDSW